MQRRKFLLNLAWLSGGVALTNYPSANAFDQNKKGIKGYVLSNGRGINNVIISDGYNVVATDKNGKYEFEPHTEATSVFISTPAGYEFKNTRGISSHYRFLNKGNKSKNINFDLLPLTINDDEHKFIIWADPQTRNSDDVEKMMKYSVPDVQKLVANSGQGALLHGITVGDMAWDDLR